MSPTLHGPSRRSAILHGLAVPLVLGFNFEEFTAAAGPAGWDRVVGMNHRQREVNRPTTCARYSAVLPRQSGMPDIGDTESGTFNGERVLALRPDLLDMPSAGRRWRRMLETATAATLLRRGFRSARRPCLPKPCRPPRPVLPGPGFGVSEREALRSVGVYADRPNWS